jgi:hypothetical protein
VWCEEPHHGVQFGVQQDLFGKLVIPLRDASGHLMISGSIADTQIPLPLRTGGHRVIAVAQLRKDIIKKAQDLGSQPGIPPLPAQTGAAGFAISVLNPPWRQRFQGQGGEGTGAFTGTIGVTTVLERPALTLAVKELVQ